MQKEKEDAAISVAMATGNTKALYNLAYCIFGLFLALTHMLLAKASNGAMSCTTDPGSAGVSSRLQPQAQAAPGCRSPPARSSQLLSALLGRQPPPRDCPQCPNVFGGEGQCRAGATRGDPSSVGFGSPGGEGGTCQGCTKLLQ